MPPSAEAHKHLERQRESLKSTFADWANLEPEDDPTDMVEAYFNNLNLGVTDRAGTASVVTTRSRAGTGAPTVLAIGSHDIGQLATAPPAPPRADRQLGGAGSSSLFGATAAFLEGFKSVAMAGTEPFNLVAVSTGPGVGVAEEIRQILDGSVDAVVMTHAVHWNSARPTVTVGSRGRLEVEVALRAPSAVHEAAYAGAVLNPLNRLVRLVDRLRDERSRIVLDDFYTRAARPEKPSEPQLHEDWVQDINGATPQGSLGSLERATQWPLISLVDISSDSHGAMIPSTATARLAIYLVPDQRPVDVERSLRSWLDTNTPPDLESSLRILSAARPYRYEPQSVAAKAQAAALKRVHGQGPTPVVAGGTIGAGEVHYATAAPVLFAGITGPLERWGTTDETLDWEGFGAATSDAQELCIELGTQLSQRHG